MGVWSAWHFDHLTWGWIVWIAFFAVWETYSLVLHPGQELTAHLRPLFLEHPLTWWLALGTWLWLGFHFLAPAAETGLLDLVRSRP
jgi:hypothetical protein